MGEKEALQLDEGYVLRYMQIVTPARVCLFGDHQDYLGLPIIACAINRYMTLEAFPNSKGHFAIHLPDIQSKRIIHFEDDEKTQSAPPDFFLTAMKVVKRYGCKPFSGYDITITSDIPINAGVSSSSALVVSWVHFLLKAFGASQEPNSEFIAQLAYEAEVLEPKSPGGKMDQYSISLGELIYLETGGTLYFELFHNSLASMILVESGIAKETLGTLSHVRSNTQQAVKFAEECDPSFEISQSGVQQVRDLSDNIPKELRPYLIAAVENHQITKQALDEFRKTNWNIPKLGALMFSHHKILKERLQVSHPDIDAYLEVAMKEGAYGGKIVGSGGGGCAVILTSPEKKEATITALLQCGAKAAYEIEISVGTYARD